MSTTSLLDSFLDPVVEILPADTARKIIELRIDPELQARPENVALGKNRIIIVDPETDKAVHCALIHVNSIWALQAA